jgi:UPF0176 protein
MKRDLRPWWEKKAAVAADGIERVTFSFYKYVELQNLQGLQEELFDTWDELGCLGRIYIAKEGINAQMNCPKKNWDKFDAYMKSKSEFADIPYKIAVEEGEESSFYKLIVRIKNKIVADGLDDKSFDVTNTGEYLTAKEMNEYVADPEAVVIDMRNIYEAEIGHFENAICPDVETFREELEFVPEKLKIHKNKKMAIYCTGGIRCEKASAWLKHNGFKHVKHLKGGIIDYKHQVQQEGLENKFLGKNFVFDERMGERIGDEVISYCHLCEKEKCDQHHNCKNDACHLLFLGCDGCMKKKKGYCSFKCITIDRLPKKLKKKLVYNSFKKRSKHFKKHSQKGRFKVGL